MVISLANGMQYHSYHNQSETHKCYGSVSQAVSTKPAGNVHFAGGFSEERVRNKYRERERKRKTERTKTT